MSALQRLLCVCWQACRQAAMLQGKHAGSMQSKQTNLLPRPPRLALLQGHPAAV